MSQEPIWEVISRLMRAQPRNPDTLRVCEEFGALLLKTWYPPDESKPVTNIPAPVMQIPPVRDVSVTQSAPVSVTTPDRVEGRLPVRNKGGRPRKENPLTPAERQRRRRERLKEAQIGGRSG